MSGRAQSGWACAALALALAFAPRASAQDAEEARAETPVETREAPEGSQPAEVEPSDEPRSIPEAEPVSIDPGHAAVARPSRAPSATRMHYRARHDVLVRWAPRYRLESDANPLGLEAQLWRRIEVLPMYHRVALDVTELADGHMSFHFAGWGALDLFADSEGGVAAGDVAIAYADVQLEPVTLWVGRRFLTYGPPGGMHVDGGGAVARSDFGLIAEAFVGRPVTPTRTTLLGPQTSFAGAEISYGGRLAYSDPGRLGLSAAYAESWGHGILGSRIVDSVAYWYPGDVHFEGALKFDLIGLGVLQGQLTARWRPAREVDVDLGFTHLEPGRWIPRWSILSVFETSTYDELAAGGTWRPVRTLALRLVASGRRYDRVGSNEPNLGYRMALYTRVRPLGTRGPRVRVIVDRRDDGVLGYTLLQAAVALDLIDELGVGLDGSFAIDDDGERESVLGRVSGDYRPSSDWTLGVTLSIARTPIAPAELRALLRARWAESS